MSVLNRFQDELKSIVASKDKFEGDKQINYEVDKTTKFIGQLEQVMRADNRKEGDAMLAEMISGEHVKFAKELTDIMNSENKHIGDSRIYALIDSLKAFQLELERIKRAGSREEGDRLIMTMIKE
ncbi:MAG: hypothetical protein LIO75_08285 [Lachnospiraceae bacterium]|nr:hypothetical protein [Lachnospiraceae bacterium]